MESHKMETHKLKKMMRKVEEMDPEERKKLKKALTEKSEGSSKMDWMYSGEKVDSEDYLLGKRVDKNAPQTVIAETSEDTSLLTEELISRRADIDMQAKMREDPLFAIRKREEEAKKRLLMNPIRMKQLQKVLKVQEKEQKKIKKKKKKHKKHKGSSSDDSGEEIMAKYLEIVNKKKTNVKSKPLEDRCSENPISNQNSENESDDLKNDKLSAAAFSNHDNSAKHRKKLKKKHKHKDFNSDSDSNMHTDLNSHHKSKNHTHHDRSKNHQSQHYAQNHPESSDDERFRKQKSIRRAQNHAESCDDGRSRKRKSLGRAENRPESSDDERSRNKKSLSHTHDNEKSKNHKPQHFGQNRADSSDDQNHMESSNDAKSRKHKSQYHAQNPTEWSDDERSIDKSSHKGSNSIKSYGLIIKSQARESANSKTHDYVYPEKQSLPETKRKKSPPKRKLTAEEMNKKREEMMSNAKWRDDQRATNVKRYKEEELKEAYIHGKNEKEVDESAFINPLLAKHASQSSVEDRVKRNIYNVQRTKADVDSGPWRK